MITDCKKIKIKGQPIASFLLQVFLLDSWEVRYLLPWWTLGFCLLDPFLRVWRELPIPAPCFEKFFFSLERSFGAIRGRSAPWTTSLLTSPVFVVSSTCSATFEEVLGVGGALGGLPCISPTSEDAGSTLEFEELEGRIVGKTPQPWLG